MKVFFYLTAILSFFIFHEISAQSYTGTSYDRFDSTNFANIKGVNEDNLNYYVWNDNNVIQVNKISGTTETIYQSNETIIDAFIDSSGSFGFIKKHKLFRLQTGTWVQENIPSDSLPLNCMVDSSGAIFIAIRKDSLCKFDNGNWSKLPLNFPYNNENLVKVLPGYYHECLVMSHIPSLTEIYKIASNGLTLYRGINTTNEANVEFDNNGTCWHREFNIIKKTAVNGVITYVTVPSTGYISNFRLSHQDGKFWIQKYYPNDMDTVFYFNGVTWEIAYSNNQSFSLFKTRGNELLIINKMINNNIINNNNIYSYLRVLDSTSITNTYILTVPLFTAGSVNCINSWQGDDIDGEFEFLIGTNHGIYLRKRLWMDMSLNYIKH